MSDSAIVQMTNGLQTSGVPAVFDSLIAALRERKEYHKLFDAICLKKKHELGVPLLRPTSFDDIPDEKKDEFERAYVAAAREVGQLLLADKKLGQAFVYFHAVRDTDPLRKVIESIPVPNQSTEESEELIDLAFYKSVHPVKGMEILLNTHGTCTTITALDQMMMNLTAEQRSVCAALLVRTLHRDLLLSVDRDVKQRIPFAEPVKTLKELTAGRDWLFAENNYHIDVSHLHSTVRFARSLTQDQPELAVARDLAQYGVQLASQFRYPGEPPFTDFYEGHIQFFNYLLDDRRDDALAYFQQQLEATSEPTEQAMIAYVMVDLLARTDQFEKALPLAEKYLIDADQNFAATFAELCQKAGRLDILLRSAEERGDLVTYATALALK